MGIMRKGLLLLKRKYEKSKVYQVGSKANLRHQEKEPKIQRQSHKNFHSEEKRF
jgi:hypothetical protein